MKARTNSPENERAIANDCPVCLAKAGNRCTINRKSKPHQLTITYGIGDPYHLARQNPGDAHEN